MRCHYGEEARFRKDWVIVVERVLLGSLLHDEGCTDDFFLHAYQLDKVISHLPPKMYVYRLGLLGCGFFGSV